MASKQSINPYHRILTQEVTRDDEPPTFAVIHSRFSTSIPEGKQCFAGKLCTSPVYPENNLCLGRENTSTSGMASKQNINLYLKIITQEVTRDDERSTFAVIRSRFSTSIPEEHLRFAGKQCTSPVYPENNLCLGRQNSGPTFDIGLL